METTQKTTKYNVLVAGEIYRSNLNLEDASIVKQEVQSIAGERATIQEVKENPNLMTFDEYSKQRYAKKHEAFFEDYNGWRIYNQKTNEWTTMREEYEKYKQTEKELLEDNK